ncbi:acyl-CoA N-acyltransferase [Macrolepiota fuliginosa MF-IS2]|uniref:Acyl-CoA N-acyltransferase n=1 Tax=Macrolepiota fuliginosa MF-IS2 TaxID=1400762 RepID=A0A9P5XF59_9AGAR|nr:acyl-CoA N-acyltransferase [Macrolepiota fuliginosa MF-IS2]
MATASLDTGYDHNFCFPVPSALENDRVKLIPFIPSRHAKPFFDAVLPYPEVFNYLPGGPYATPEEVSTTFFVPVIHKNQGNVLFLLIDKTKKASPSSAQFEGEDGAIAGHLAYINSSPVNLATEIGWILILPPFQRTHVTSNAVGLMMHYALDLPDRSGLGLRRVCWQANALNLPSRRLAERMGFNLEGILRWDRVLPRNKQEFGNGVKVRDGDSRGEDCVGRDTAMLSHCWDDWESRGRDSVDAIMARVG